jgi:hypothetical protein
MSPEDLPGWARTTLMLLLGAGGARLLDVWLENRRLERKDYRDTLSTRIRVLEGDIADCHERSASLQERVGGRLREAEEDRDAEFERVERLDEENARLRARLLEVDPDLDSHASG